jgi:hypothetical protein
MLAKSPTSVSPSKAGFVGSTPPKQEEVMDRKTLLNLVDTLIELFPDYDFG